MWSPQLSNTVSTQPLCQHCSNVFQAGSYTPWAQYCLSCRSDPAGYSPAPIRHSTSSQLEAAATAGCWLCSLIFDAMVQRFQHKSQEYEIKYHWPKVNEAHVNYQVEFWLSGELQLKPDFCSLEPGASLTYGYRLLKTFGMQLVDGDADLWTAARISRSKTFTGDPALLQLGSKWLEKCVATHPKCRPTGPAVRPSRLLDISTDTIRLVDDAERIAQSDYATLSHCWGSEPFFTLNVDNYEAFKSGVPIADFPLNFQQSMAVARSLRLKYIWIDSYTIIQGSDDVARADWDNESSKMQHVYAGGHINVACGNAAGPKHGCFRERVTSRPDAAGIRWQPQIDMDEKSYMIMDNTTGFELIPELKGFDESPLFQRAWVLQETVLSRRMLTFTDNGVWWQCLSTSLASEEYPESIRRGYQSNPDSITDTLPFYTLERLRTQVSRTRQCEEWLNLLAIYGDTALTFPNKDKLRAVEGVAQRISEITNDAHMDGMFHGHMPYGLLWSPAAARAAPERAPSWHWASWDGPWWASRPAMSDIPYSKPLAYILPELAMAPTPTRSRLSDQSTILCIGRLIMTKSLQEQGFEDCRISPDGRPSNLEEHVRLLPLIIVREVVYSSRYSLKFAIRGLALVPGRGGHWRRVGTFHGFFRSPLPGRSPYQTGSNNQLDFAGAELIMIR